MLRKERLCKKEYNRDTKEGLYMKVIVKGKFIIRIKHRRCLTYYGCTVTVAIIIYRLLLC